MFAYKYPKIDVDDSAYIMLLSLIGVRIFFFFFGKLMDCRSVAFHFKTFLTTNYLLFKTVCNKLC